MTAKKHTTKPAKAASRATGFSDIEKEAMRERVREMKAEANAAKDKDAGEKDVMSKIAAMKEPDRAMAKRLHALIKSIAPGLTPRTWYGMPAYAKDGKVLCFFQSGQKFKTRYATFGFSDTAKLDDGDMWATGFALKQMNAATEAKITDLLKKAIG